MEFFDFKFDDKFIAGDWEGLEEVKIKRPKGKPSKGKPHQPSVPIMVDG